MLGLPQITGRDLLEVARAKKSAGDLDGRAWNEIKALPLAWFSGLATLGGSYRELAPGSAGCVCRHDSQG